MSDAYLSEAAARLRLLTHELAKYAEDLEVAFGLKVAFDAPWAPTPHLFATVMRTRSGRGDISWAFIGAAECSPWDQTNLGDNARLRQMLKSYGRAAFVRLPIHVVTAGINGHGLRNVEQMFLNSMGAKRDHRLFNDPTQKDEAPVSDQMPDTQVTEVPVPREEQTETAVPIETPQEEGEPAAERDAAEAGEEANGTKRRRGRRSAEARATNEGLSPRVEKWTQGRISELQGLMKDRAVPNSYSVAKKWHDVKKEHDGNEAAAVKVMRVWLIEKEQTK